MTIPPRSTSSKARSRRFAPSSPMSPPTTRWRGCPTTCTCCRPRSTSSPAPRGNGDSFAVLEQRIAALTSTLESRERPAAGDNTEQLEGALRALSDRFDRMPVGNDSASAFAHLEQRVSYLLERIETSSDPRSGNLGRVEDGLQDILRHLERQHANLVALAESNRNAARRRHGHSTAASIDMVKRELSDIRFSQSETDRRTQDSLEAVHNTLGHVVDRLSMIEGDLRTVRSAPIAPRRSRPPCRPNRGPRRPALRRRWRWRRSRNPNCRIPAASTQEPPQAHFAAAPREFHAAQPPAAPAPPQPPRAISEILEPHAAPPRAAIEPDLPPDHPLEPGTRPTGRAASPSERIAASESAISEIPHASRTSRSARRASSPPRAAPRRPPPPQPANEKAAAAAVKPRPRQGQGSSDKRARTRTRSPRPSPPRSARCWSARAWS